MPEKKCQWNGEKKHTTFISPDVTAKQEKKFICQMRHRHHPLSCCRLKCDVPIYFSYISPYFSVAHRFSFHALLATKFSLWTKEETQAGSPHHTVNRNSCTGGNLHPSLSSTNDPSEHQYLLIHETNATSAPGVPFSHHKIQVENWIHLFCCLEKAMVESLQKELHWSLDDKPQLLNVIL